MLDAKTLNLELAQGGLKGESAGVRWRIVGQMPADAMPF